MQVVKMSFLDEVRNYVNDPANQCKLVAIACVLFAALILVFGLAYTSHEDLCTPVDTKPGRLPVAKRVASKDNLSMVEFDGYIKLEPGDQSSPKYVPLTLKSVVHDIIDNKTTLVKLDAECCTIALWFNTYTRNAQPDEIRYEAYVMSMTMKHAYYGHSVCSVAQELVTGIQMRDKHSYKCNNSKQFPCSVIYDIVATLVINRFRIEIDQKTDLIERREFGSAQTQCSIS